MPPGGRQRLPRAVGIGGVLRSVLQQRGMTGRLREYRAWQVWNEVVGPQIAAHAQPCGIRDGVLEIKVDQPVWMQQLQLLKPKLLARLNEHLGGPLFRDLFLRRGRLAAANPAPSAVKPLPPPVPLDAATEAQIAGTVAGLADADLRQRLAHLLRRQAQLEARRKAAQEPLRRSPAPPASTPPPGRPKAAARSAAPPRPACAPRPAPSAPPRRCGHARSATASPPVAAPASPPATRPRLEFDADDPRRGAAAGNKQRHDAAAGAKVRHPLSGPEGREYDQQEGVGEKR